MNLKIAILTTETPHHIHFVRELSNYYKDIKIFCETGKTKLQYFKNLHSFEKKRSKYEASIWFKEKKIKIQEVADTNKFVSINNIDAFKAIKKYNADLIIVFGTSPLKNKIISLNPNKILNLHGGDPERYRGLDSHLWAIYHNDFSALWTTLHRLTAKLDSGDIVAQSSIPITRNLPLHALQAINTNICVKLTLSAIDMYDKYGIILSRQQRNLGRYYSAMPKDIKTICLQKFNNFTKNIKNAT